MLRIAATTLATTLALCATAVAHPGHDHGAPASAERGHSLAGLTDARPGTCDARYEVLGDRVTGRCTHGPDLAPAGTDVTEPRTVAELRTDAADEPTAVPCIGDGVSGPRIQAIYARPAGQPDRFEALRPSIERWAAGVAATIADGAQRTGGTRVARFLTPGCRLDIRHEVVSDEAARELGVMSRELLTRGYDREDRRYLVWMDARAYCGIAHVDWLFARVDSGCWGYAETHELIHTLGGVDPAAPNATRGWHCTDEHDVMCYSDTPDYPAMRLVCPPEFERRLDCGGDDYFNAAPRAGSFLSRTPEANTADREFLGDGDGEPPVFLPPGAPADRHRYRVRLDNAADRLCAFVAAATGSWTRAFCVGAGGEREADVTGALAAVAGDGDGRLRLVGSARGAERSFGFTVLRDGVAVLSERGGAGLPDLGTDPVTGGTVFVERELGLTLRRPPVPTPTVGGSGTGTGTTTTVTTINTGTRVTGGTGVTARCTRARRDLRRAQQRVRSARQAVSRARRARTGAAKARRLRAARGELRRAERRAQAARRAVWRAC